ncbi:MAG TPA: DUF3180 domain-containing protein [Trebonia sp.]|jgi:uncharacterized membrane protein YfcA|nr:DUF3180 domain-containing protein [Trebonia sp.]
MRPTRPRFLLLIALVCGAVTWALLHAIYSRLPPLTWSFVPALLIAGGVEAWIGRDLRARIAGDRADPAPPLFVARMLVLAKASAQVAAIFGGIALGFMIYLSVMLSASTPRQDMVTAGLTFAASLLLAVAALWLEYCCRVPKSPDDDQDRDERDKPAPFPHR